jgi:hypothetical protein
LEFGARKLKPFCWFGLAKWILLSLLQSLLRMVREEQRLAGEECNKYDLTAGVPVIVPIVMIGPSGLLLLVSHLFGISWI